MREPEFDQVVAGLAALAGSRRELERTWVCAVQRYGTPTIAQLLLEILIQRIETPVMSGALISAIRKFNWEEPC